MTRSSFGDLDICLGQMLSWESESSSGELFQKFLLLDSASNWSSTHMFMMRLKCLAQQISSSVVMSGAF